MVDCFDKELLKRMAVCFKVLISLGGEESVSPHGCGYVVHKGFADYSFRDIDDLFFNWAIPRIELDLMEQAETLQEGVLFVKDYLGHDLWHYVKDYIDFDNVSVGFSLLNKVEERDV